MADRKRECRRRFGNGLFAVVFFFCLFFSCLSHSALAASLLFSPGSGTYPSGQNFTINVQVNAEGSPVNSSQGTITFDATKLQVVNVSKEGSAFNLWVTEPSFSNSAGTVSYSGGGTSVVSGTRNILSITFRGRAEGAASVGARDVKILAGAGQDVTGTIGTATYTIGPAAAAPAPTPQPQTTQSPGGGIVPQPPRSIESPTHPDTDKWYGTSTVRFSWDITSGVIGVRTLFDQNATSTPEETLTPPTASAEYFGVADGVWYFHLSFQNRNGWGGPAHRMVRVDTTPPQEFEVVAQGGDLSGKLTFFTTDEHSGVKEYLIQIDGIQADRISAERWKEGDTHTLSNLKPGAKKVVVVAIDNAGNERVSETTMEVTGVLPVAGGAAEPQSPFGPVYWVSIIFTILLAVAVGMLYFERKRHGEEHDRIKAEAVEASERLVNIFDVLREEIEEKVLSLAHKPNMTDTERATLQTLKEALDIAEELLDKEIEDVRKLVK